MKQNALKDYLKKKRPDLYAADGGEVPDDEEDLDKASENEAVDAPQEVSGGTAEFAPAAEEETDDATEDLDASAAKEAPAQPDASLDKTPEDQKTDAVKAYLAEQMAKAGSDKGIKAAQASRNWRDMVAGIGQGAQQMAMSNGVARGLQPPSGKEWDALRKSGEQEVQEATQQRQSSINQFLQSNELNRQVAQDQMARGTYENQQKAAKYIQDRQDPSSVPSQNAQLALKKLFPEETKGLDLSTFSAADAEMAAKQIDIKGNQQMRKAQMQQIWEWKQEQARLKKEAVDKKTAVTDLTGLAKDLDNETASSRTGLGVANSKVDGATRLMTFADVTPAEIAEAKKNPKAMAALQQRMDKLTPQQYGEVVAGLMTQIAPGSGGGLGMFEHLRANTAEQTMANARQFFSSNPVPAGAGALIANNLITLANERDTSQAIIDKHSAQMKAKHPTAFDHEDTKDKAENMVKAFGRPQAQPQAQQAPQAPAYPKTVTNGTHTATVQNAQEEAQAKAKGFN